jgi:hypothetical protein
MQSSGERRLPACSCRQLTGNTVSKRIRFQECFGEPPKPTGWQPVLPNPHDRFLHKKQRGIFEKLAKFFQILRAKRAVDHAVIATHPDGHAMANDDLIVAVHDWPF